MFTNKFPNYDDLRTLDGFGATFKLGRWFSRLMGAVAWHLDFVFSLPWVNGLLTLLLVALSAGFMADLLKIKSTIGNILFGVVGMLNGNLSGISAISCREEVIC